MIVTIDGPAGAGKSTVAQKLAQRLGYRYLDTGSMYRAVALAGLCHQVDWQRPEQLVRLARELQIEVVGDRIFLSGEDVSAEIRGTEVTAVTRFAANNPEIREQLVALQRAAAAGESGVVTEGRDQGSVVFPTAPFHIFLTGGAAERARRRVADLRERGEIVDFEPVLQAIVRRDREDASRAVGPLVKPVDAIEVSTDGLTIEQVVDRLEAIVAERSERASHD